MVCPYYKWIHFGVTGTCSLKNWNGFQSRECPIENKELFLTGIQPIIDQSQKHSLSDLMKNMSRNHGVKMGLVPRDPGAQTPRK